MDLIILQKHCLLLLQLSLTRQSRRSSEILIKWISVQSVSITLWGNIWWLILLWLILSVSELLPLTQLLLCKTLISKGDAWITKWRSLRLPLSALLTNANCYVYGCLNHMQSFSLLSNTFRPIIVISLLSNTLRCIWVSCLLSNTFRRMIAFFPSQLYIKTYDSTFSTYRFWCKMLFSLLHNRFRRLLSPRSVQRSAID